MQKQQWERYFCMQYQDTLDYHTIQQAAAYNAAEQMNIPVAPYRYPSTATPTNANAAIPAPAPSVGNISQWNFDLNSLLSTPAPGVFGIPISCFLFCFFCLYCAISQYFSFFFDKTHINVHI